jgi:hypothetical protein
VSTHILLACPTRTRVERSSAKLDYEEGHHGLSHEKRISEQLQSPLHQQNECSSIIIGVNCCVHRQDCCLEHCHSTVVHVMIALLLCLTLTSRLVAQTIHIQEELPAYTFLIAFPSPELSWLSTSLIFQRYFILHHNNNTLSTGELPLDREELCREQRCNCSACWISLKFMFRCDVDNFTIRSVNVLIEGKRRTLVSFPDETIRANTQISMIIQPAFVDRLFVNRLPKMSLWATKFHWNQ